MEIRIFNVRHGFCAYVIADTTNVILIDCGYNERTDWSPYKYLYGESRCTGIEQLVITNSDEDHIADLPNLRQEPIRTLFRNRSLSADQLEALKREGGPISDAMKSLLDLIRTYTGEITTPIDFGGVAEGFFSNPYPTFKDTNNLSLAYFLHYRNIHILFPGDLESPGWTELVKRDDFRKELATVNIFVASHHGRENGYCKGVFDYCKPRVVVISDAEHEGNAQVNMYANHASGIPWSGSTKRVLTTWQDGTIVISQTATGQATITTM